MNYIIASSNVVYDEATTVLKSELSESAFANWDTARIWNISTTIALKTVIIDNTTSTTVLSTESTGAEGSKYNPYLITIILLQLTSS